MQKSKRCLTPEKLTKVYDNWLKLQFPALFNGEFHPLALGIFSQLSEQLPEHISKTDLRVVLGWYGSRLHYLKNIQKGMHRRNIDGSFSAEITLEEKVAANKKAQEYLKLRYPQKSTAKPIDIPTTEDKESEPLLHANV